MQDLKPVFVDNGERLRIGNQEFEVAHLVIERGRVKAYLKNDMAVVIKTKISIVR